MAVIVPTTRPCTPLLMRVKALGLARTEIRVVSVGVGVYPEPKRWTSLLKRFFLSVQLLQKTLSVNTASMEQLRITTSGDSDYGRR